MTIFSFITWDLSFRDRLYSIESIVSAFKDSDDYEILLVGSSKSITTLSQKAQDKLIYLEKTQNIYHPGSLLHFGARHANGQYLIFCDADLIFPDSLPRFLNCINDSKSIALFNRYHGMKPKNANSVVDYKYYTDSMNQYENSGSKFYLPKKFNNYATCIATPRSAYYASGGFDESPLFSTMSTLFCYDLYYRAKKYCTSFVKVSPYPCFHPWHETPKIQLTLTEKRQIKLYLLIQRIAVLTSEKNSYLRNLLNILFKPFISSFCLKWAKP